MPDDVTPAADPFFLDGEQLQTIASPAIVRRGIAYFKEDRVTDLGWSEERVWAAVDGSRPGAYQVDVSLDRDRELIVECDCPFDWEPACKHAIATLLAYGARQPVTERQKEGAASDAVEARMRRGRSEVEVKHVAGDRWLGTWEARSLTSKAQGRDPWRVELRSVGDRINYCNCPDFAVNRLGTCKHIEAVLHRLRKRAPRKFERYAEEGPPTGVVHLEWVVPDAPRVRLRRAAGEPPAWLADHFDDDGFLRGRLPEAYDRLLGASGAKRDLIITAEVGAHVRRRIEEVERRARMAALGERIRASGGTLPGVSARLYPYQVEGVAFLAANGRALLADDMGLGKTLQSIAAAAVLREHEMVRRTLVVCPASLKHQWAREVERFTELEAVVIEGPPDRRSSLYTERAPFTMVNYELLLRDSEAVQAKLSPDLLILDEAQRIKNWRTKTAAAVKSLETPFAFVLTGTPLENRLEDLYSVMQVVDPRVLGPLWCYLLDFHVTDERGKVLGYRNLARLRRRLAPVMLRRDRALVRDQLPERIETRLDVILDRRQRGLHDEAMGSAGRLAKIARKRPLTPSEEKRLLAALQTARMACNAAGLVDDETVGSPKLTELRSVLEELCVDGARKIVVFSQWERMTRMAERVARELDLGVVRLHGGVPTSRRGALIDRFREDPTVRVFLSTDAGGVGLNLQAASAVVNLDLPWNPAVLEQRIGRVHRLGQKESVQVVLLVARDSYEERIAGLIAAKRHLFRNVVEETASDDVVGVSKKMVEMAVGTLVEDADADPAAAEQVRSGGPVIGTGADRALHAGDAAEAGTAPEPGEAAEAGTVGRELEVSVAGEQGSGDGPTTAEPAEADDVSLAPLISRLQATLDGRIERVVAVGGGLVVVVDIVDPAAEELARSCEAEARIAMVDSRSWAALTRLGPNSPVAGRRLLFEKPAKPAAEAQAKRKLSAAEVLARQGHDREALNLATAAMLHSMAEAAGTTPPPVDRAAVWLYTEMVPRGFALPEHAARIGRGLALAGASHVPAELVTQVLDDAAALVRGANSARPPERP